MLISINDITFGYDNISVIENITAQINEGDKIGLLGVNGAGKSTLVKNILGELIPDEGAVTRKNGLCIGYLAQNAMLESNNTVYAEMKSVFVDVAEVEKKLVDAQNKMSVVDHNSLEYRRLVSEYEKLNDLFIARDGYNIDVKIKTVLNGLGFSLLYDRIISSLSGGERTRLALAKLLLIEPELLILDEPTNHLDFDTLYWLERFLSTYKGALLVVSHDRYFLDKTVNIIWDIVQKNLYIYRGNYTKFKSLKADRLERWQKEYERQQNKIAAMEDYAARNIARDSTSKSAKSRLHQLANLERVEKPVVNLKSPNFTFKFANKSVKAVLTVKSLELSHPNNKLLNSADFCVERGDRTAIVGANGTGKSTLIKRLYKASISPDSNAYFGGGTKVGYYDQESADLDKNLTVLEQVTNKFPRESQTLLRARLGAALLSGDTDKLVGNLSGGERAKLALCLLSLGQYNVLLLDEPTNHLDMQAREALEDALEQFSGTLIFVSHDRYFLNKLGKRFLKIKNGELIDFAGTFTEFEEKETYVDSQIERAQKQTNLPSEKNIKSSYRSKSDRSNEVKIKLRLAAVEKDILDNEVRKKDMEENNLFITEEGYKKYNAVLQKIDELYAEWEKLSAEVSE